ncbi:serine protease Do [Evansella vedderi]|uniref:Serine protease Do n=1 Tax=Evansella vedderi TaxID=38282 RepID=A0ABT9ZRW5_9BACI|nr:serine protease [Evansella vedderi]MDQ0253481.1 serine protease Do [Evansella vedderi]
MDEFNKDKEKDSHNQEEEELYFDGERYYTREEFFNPDDEEEEIDPKKKKTGKWLKVTIASILTVALLSNVLSLWPQLFNLASIEFLAISRELSQNEDVQAFKESVVVVRAGDSKGTGFYISNEGHIMTNYHVIDNLPQMVTVSFQDGKRYPASVVMEDPAIDIAILQIEGENLDRPVLEFEETWEEGLPVYIIGNPLFFNFIANRGHVLDLTPTRNRDDPMLMIDAPIYKGNSGSPVINHDGKVVGVVYATTRVDYEGDRIRVGLAVPVDYFKKYLDDF